MVLVRRLVLFCACLSLLSGAAYACERDYWVKSGDTLSAIAQVELGSVFHLPALQVANGPRLVRNPDLLNVGQRLTLPCLEGDGQTLFWSVMPTPETLVRLRKQTGIQVLDVRSAKSVSKGTIPGAISIPFSKWRGPKDNPGRPMEAEALARLIGDAGLTLDQPIVLVHEKPNAMDMGRAALVYWQLKSAGAEQLAILRGGFRGWKATELPVSDAPQNPKPYEAQVSLSLEWRADIVDVYGIATGQVAGSLLDARPHSVVSRLTKLGAPKATTLPGARNVPIPGLFKSVLAVDPEDGVREVLGFLEDNAVDWRKDSVVSFCNTGELAALNWFYASELAGLRNFKLYPESVRGWTDDGGILFEPEQSG